jgi:hypothetical protein
MFVALAQVWRSPALRYPSQTMALMGAMDDDGDGRLDATEFHRRAPTATPIEVFDLDQSGFVDPHELEAMILAVDPIWLAFPPR